LRLSRGTSKPKFNGSDVQSQAYHQSSLGAS
jgi:hypothetical protein